MKREHGERWKGRHESSYWRVPFQTCLCVVRVTLTSPSRVSKGKVAIGCESEDDGDGGETSLLLDKGRQEIKRRGKRMECRVKDA